MDNAVKD